MRRICELTYQPAPVSPVQDGTALVLLFQTSHQREEADLSPPMSTLLTKHCITIMSLERKTCSSKNTLHTFVTDSTIWQPGLKFGINIHQSLSAHTAEKVIKVTGH